MRANQTGMTLIELMITVAIVAILASIAIPSYRHYVIRANRADAKAGLLATAAALERCYTRFNSYDHDDCNVELPIDSPDRNYSIEPIPGDDAITASRFTLQAVPQGAQAQDTKCAIFILDNRNRKTVSTGDAASRDCWGK